MRSSANGGSLDDSGKDSVAISASALRPRSAAESVDTAFVLLRRDYWVFVCVAGLMHLPIHSTRLAMALAGSDFVPASLNPELLWWNFWNSLAVSAVSVAAARSYLRGGVTLGAALGSLRSRLWSVVAATVIVEALFEIGLLLVIVPGVLVLARLFATVPALYAERIGVWPAMRRSVALTRGYFWRVLPAGLIILAIGLVDSTLPSAVTKWTGSGAVTVIFDFMLDSAMYPLIGVAFTVLYYDLRILKEGYDIEVMMASFGSRESGVGSRE
ncbi:MAG: hypothetical protein ABR543_14435 [Gemmatimonadaceae bacterium]